MAQEEVSYPNHFTDRLPESLPSRHGVQPHSQPLYMPTCHPNRESPARLPFVDGSERYLPKLSIGEFCGDRWIIGLLLIAMTCILRQE